MKKSTSRLLAVVLLLLIAYIGYQVSNASNFIKTEQIAVNTVNDAIIAKGFLLRQEQQLKTSKRGVVITLVSDGDRVGKGDAVAAVCSDNSDAAKYQKIKSLEQTISQLELITATKGSFSLDNAKLEDQVQLLLMQISGSFQAKDMESVGKATDDLSLLLSKKQLVTGDAQTFQAHIDQLKKQKTEEEKGISRSVATVTTPVSGYFTSFTDGYEELLKPENSAQLTVSDLQNLSQKQMGKTTQSGVVGKIISDYYWKVACLITEDQGKELSVGKSYMLNFPYSLEQSVSAKLESISQPEDGHVVAVFKSDYNISEFSESRNQTVEIIKRSYTGFKISWSALRIKDGQEGVYVVNGMQVFFKPVNIIYRGSDYFIASQESGSDSLEQYNKVVVKGRNLFDGKIID